jgi:DNA-binding NtrC family response regulator
MPAILLVDDDLNLLSGLRRVLREQPYDLFTANSAEMAINMFQRQPFDLVVADQEMSGKSGLELIAWLASAFPETTRIMLTGRANIEVAKQAINEGKVFRFLTKPCHDLELALAIRDGLEAQQLC